MPWLEKHFKELLSAPQLFDVVRRFGKEEPNKVCIQSPYLHYITISVHTALYDLPHKGNVVYKGPKTVQKARSASPWTFFSQTWLNQSSIPITLSYLMPISLRIRTPGLLKCSIIASARTKNMTLCKHFDMLPPTGTFVLFKNPWVRLTLTSY